jgi:hypothetical protein
MDADWMRGKQGICIAERFFKGGKRIKKDQILTLKIKILKK